MSRQQAALLRFGKPLVSVTVVMPGPVKDGLLPRQLLATALRALNVLARGKSWPVLSRETRWIDTGPEALYVFDVESRRLKQATVALEEQHPLGRLWDLDVIAPGHSILSRRQMGLPERPCLLCERPASECGRSRRHATEALVDVTQRMVNDYERRWHS